MITIKKPTMTVSNGRARLSADLIVDKYAHPLWLEVDEQYGQYLCHERCDAFVVGILMWAMRQGHDIVSEAPMTDRLYEQLTEQFLPALYKINMFSRIRGIGCGWPVDIKVDLAPEVQHPLGGDAIGSGVSCGVDSLHVFARHPEISHGCVWHAYGVVPEETDDRRNAAWRNMKARAEAFCSHIGIDCIVADTNFDRNCVDGLLWDGMTTYGNLFCVLALQKLWAKYYVASGYDIGDFMLTGVPMSDPAHYEWVLFSMLSMKNISVRMDGVAQNRVEKVKDIIDYEPAWQFLNVCHEITDDGRNCSFGCAKCMRTMLDLDVNGGLDRFRRVFDVEYYRRHFHEYLAEFYRGCLQGNSFAIELKPYLATLKYTTTDRIAALKIVAKKSLKKLLRCGKTRQGKFSPRG